MRLAPRRLTCPELPSAEVAHDRFSVTVSTEWRVLPCCPLFVFLSVFGQTVVAVAAVIRPQSTQGLLNISTVPYAMTSNVAFSPVAVGVGGGDGELVGVKVGFCGVSGFSVGCPITLSG